MNILGYRRPNSKREMVQIDRPTSGPVENPFWKHDGYLLNGTFSGLEILPQNWETARQNPTRAKAIYDEDLEMKA